ncbi:putative sialidase-1 [Apostichopus japonicus]|uniref:Sialidase-1 n=1 Tax=Stichopus japonicus TaxID=307972 RepID=A0A2G8KJ04_STIJA|nr:putative sialidase-1 [Apostichopus japonicus]
MEAKGLIFVILLSSLCLSYGAEFQVSPLIVEEQLLWMNNIEYVTMYRCPLITYTPKGNLLAIVEGRKSSTGDASSKFIVTKRSTDGGSEWSEESFIYDDGKVVDGDNLGAILVDDDTASIFLFFTLCPHHKNCTITSMMYMKSVDDGITWQKPVNISASMKGDGFPMPFGPGRGIQLKNGKYKGRLLACGHRNSYVQCIYSDDHGKTWTYGLTVESIPSTGLKKGDFAPNENQPEELPDGTVMLNIRNEYSYHCKCRIVGLSTDGGESYRRPTNLMRRWSTQCLGTHLNVPRNPLFLQPS